MSKSSARVSIEVGLVSANRAIVDFYVLAFGLRALPPLEFEAGTLHRLRADDGMVKVLLPKQPPTGSGERPYMSQPGLGYLTVSVVAFDAVLERVEQGGGTVVDGVRLLGQGRRLAMVRDPDGTTIEVVEALSD